MGFKTVELVLAAAVANSGTVTGIAYPSGTNQAFFTSGNASASGVAVVNGNDVYPEAAAKVSISYGAATITLTNSSGVSWPAGSDLLLQLGYATPLVATVIRQPAFTDIGASPTQANFNALLATLRAAGVIATS